MIESFVVSVVMPVYNRGHLVEQMINSILNQTFFNWELILVDDGSDTDTLDILKQFAANYNNIFLYERAYDAPKGAQTCRNIGLKKSKGKYICFFDSDDLVPKFCLEQRVSFMESNPWLDFAVFPYIEYENDIKAPVFCGGLKYYKDDFYAFLQRRLPFMVWSNIYKRESLIKNNILWDLNLKSLQDADFNLQTIHCGMLFDYSNSKKADYYNRISSTKGASISRGIFSVNNFDSHIYYYRKTIAYAGNSRNSIKACRQGGFYLYSIMLTNYSAEHMNKIIESIREKDCCYFFYWKLKDYIIRYFFKPLRVPDFLIRWLVFPLYSISRKTALNARNKYISHNIIIENLI